MFRTLFRSSLDNAQSLDNATMDEILQAPSATPASSTPLAAAGAEAEEYARLRAEAVELFPITENASNELVGVTAALRFTHTHPRWWSREASQTVVRDLVKWAYRSPRALLNGEKRTQEDVAAILETFWNHPVHGLRSVAQARKASREAQEAAAAAALDF